RTVQPKPPHRRNEPMYLPLILEAVAACRGQAPGEVAAQTTANAQRFFGIKLTAGAAEPQQANNQH
ncbi:MAG: TatD family hydrolase, partial [Steroidobacteraceae bacterium]